MIWMTNKLFIYVKPQGLNMEVGIEIKLHGLETAVLVQQITISSIRLD